MKTMKYLQLITAAFLLAFIACKDAPERPDPMLDPNYQPTETATTNTTPISAGTVNTSGGTVHHYTCPNGCGGGPSAGTCPVCGSAYTHNQAFHNQTNNTTTTTPATPTTPITPTQSPTQTPEPAQNAAGVWHYTCPSGCAGGAGSAVACATCGTILTHNQAYHQ